MQVFESRFRPMKLTLTECQEKTLMKLVVDADTDKVLGCHMVGPDAGEIVQGLAIALKAGATKRHFDETIGVHPRPSFAKPSKAHWCARMKSPNCIATTNGY